MCVGNAEILNNSFLLCGVNIPTIASNQILPNEDLGWRMATVSSIELYRVSSSSQSMYVCLCMHVCVSSLHVTHEQNVCTHAPLTESEESSLEKEASI